MTYDGSEYLVIVDYYSKMPIVRKMPTSQCNSAKTITVLKELFAEHGIPGRDLIRQWDPSLQVTSLQNSLRTGTLSTVHLHQGTPGAMDKQSLQSRLSKVCLPVPMCSGQDPYLALLAYRSTPVDSTSTITCRDALPTCSTHNCATKDQAQGPLCSSLM